MELNTNRLDIGLRQMPEPKTQQDKLEDDSSGFKKLMKQKKATKDKGPEKKDKKQKSELSAQEAAASEAVTNQGKTPDATDPENASLKKAVLAMGTVNPTKDVNEDPAGRGQTDAMDSIQFLNELRLKNWNAGEQGMKQPGEELKVSLKDNTNVMEKAGSNHILPQGQGKKLEAKTIVDTKEPEAVVIQKEHMEIKDKSAPITELLAGDKTDKGVKEQRDSSSLLEMGKKNSSKEEENDQTINMVLNKSFSKDALPHIQNEKEATALTHMQVQDSEDLKDKLTEQMLKQIHTGNKNLEVQLEPHNLGKIQLKVTYEDNQVNVSVVCSETRTLKMLTHSASELGAILEHNLERPIHIIVDKSANDYMEQQSENQGNNHGQSQQEPHGQTEDKRDDFFQKLRLGLFDSELNEISDTIYT